MNGRPNYQLEPTELREPIWESRVIVPLQLMRIAAWKSARGLAPLTMNSDHVIRTRTGQLIETIEPFRHVDVVRAQLDVDGWETWRQAVAAGVGSKSLRTGLLGLEGFGYPMASAFLALLAPAAFPVIDRWTLRAVYGSTSGNFQRSVVYADFAQHLVRHAGHYPDAAGIHEIDQLVMNAAMNCKHDLRGCACLPFKPSVMPS